MGLRRESPRELPVKRDLSLVGLGLYSPGEAAALTHIPVPKIRRWLCGHVIGDKDYPALWRSQLEKFEMEQLYLSFLDLVQLRVAKAFIDAGLSPQKVRRAIEYGADRDPPRAQDRWRRGVDRSVQQRPIPDAEGDR